MEPFNPLTTDHYQRASQGCQECDQLTHYLERLRSLGLDVQSHLDQVQAIRTFLQGVRTTFFPHMG